MINKMYMNHIIREVKKEKLIVIKYLASEEEKEYLKKFNIKCEIKIVKQQCLLSDNYYDAKYCTYYLDK